MSFFARHQFTSGLWPDRNPLTNTVQVLYILPENSLSAHGSPILCTVSVNSDSSADLPKMLMIVILSSSRAQPLAVQLTLFFLFSQRLQPSL